MIAAKDLVPGKNYRVHHSRKGTFWIRVKSVDGEWISGTITQGLARAVMSYNVCEEGDDITIRDAHSAFYEDDAPPVEARDAE